jgi:ribosomal protein L7/L12
MIKIEMTVREMLNIIALQGTSGDLADRIICALEVACNQNQRKSVTITGGMDLDNRIKCIKTIRLATGWGLKESKDWTDYLVGGWKYDKWVPAAKGVKHTLTLSTPELAEQLLRDLTSFGCEGYLS